MIKQTKPKKNKMNDIQYLEDKIKNCEELQKRCRVTSKTHYNVGELNNHLNNLLGLMTTIAGISNVGFVTGKSFNSVSRQPLVSLIGVCSAAALTVLKPSAASIVHHNAGVDYSNLERKANEWKLNARRVINNKEISKIELLDKKLTKLWNMNTELNKYNPCAYEIVHWYTKWKLNKKPLDN